MSEQYACIWTQSDALDWLLIINNINNNIFILTPMTFLLINNQKLKWKPLIDLNTQVGWKPLPALFCAQDCTVATANLPTCVRIWLLTIFLSLACSVGFKCCLVRKQSSSICIMVWLETVDVVILGDNEGAMFFLTRPLYSSSVARAWDYVIEPSTPMRLVCYFLWNV